MHLHMQLILATFGMIGVIGQPLIASPEPKPIIGPVVIITATYPDATASMIADTIAAPIEQHLTGADGLMRIESESRNDGTYHCWVRFEPEIDAKLAVKLVQNRVAVALPLLPETVRKAKIDVKIEPEITKIPPVMIALIDPNDIGHAAMQAWAAAVMKQLLAKGIAVKPIPFPGADEEQMHIEIDREKTKKLGLTLDAIFEAIRVLKPTKELKHAKGVMLTSRTGVKVPLDSVVTFQIIRGPTAVFRVNLDRAVRISGVPPKGQDAYETAVKWVKIAESEQPRGMKVANLTAKPRVIEPKPED